MGRYLSSTLIFIVLTLFLLIGCSKPTPVPTETEAVLETPSGPVGYPYPYPLGEVTEVYTPDPGYPPPPITPFFADLPDTLEIPEPPSDKGVITGQLLTPGPGGQPYYATLYLAHTIESSEDGGYPPIISFSEDENPIAQQDKSGRFLFVDIPPGEYALAIWSPISSTIIQDPDTGDYLVFTVKAGEITDLGVISIP